MSNAVIVAHFDLNNSFSRNFLELIACLKKYFDDIVVVSTSTANRINSTEFKNVRVISRPNFGYDFYSYKVGVISLDPSINFNSIFLINSSFWITDNVKFEKTIKRLIYELSHSDVVGVTESRQFAWHIQSYILGFNHKTATSKWFKDFIYQIQPQNTKQEVIFEYELGLSRKIKEHKLKCSIIFKPNFFRAILARYLWLCRIVQLKNLTMDSLKVAVKHFKDVNITHFLANELADCCGIIKNEVIKKNPHQINLKKTIFDKVNIDELRHDDGHMQGLLMPFRTCSRGNMSDTKITVAVLVHIYYADLLDEITDALKLIPDQFDLHITTPFEKDIALILDKTSCLSRATAIHVFENRGRDIGPFISIYLSSILDKYSAVLKLHTKKSNYSANGAEWRKSIYTDLIGKNSIKSRKIIQRFNERRIGICGPSSYYLVNNKYWGANRDRANEIAQLVGLIGQGQMLDLGFFAGSMFWFAPAALKSLKGLKANNFQFESESGQQDGTLAHVFERLFAQIVKSEEYEILSADLETLDLIGAIKNRVPVL